MLKSLLMQIKTHPVGSVLLILGYTICVLAFSIGVNYSKHTKDLDLDLNNGYSEHNIYKIVNFTGEINFDELGNFIENISKGTEVQLIRQNVSITKTVEADLAAISYNIYPEYTVPLMSGRYISKEDLEKGEKVAVIGSALEENTYEIGTEKYIDFGDETFRIVGIAGRRNSGDLFKNIIYIPLKYIPNDIKKAINEDYQLKILIRKNGSEPAAESKQFDEGIMLLDNSAIIEDDSPMTVSIGSARLRNTIIEVVLILITGIINIVNVSIFWILDRTREIAVKKTFGAGNYTLGYEIFKEILSLSITGAILSLIIQFIMDFFIADLFKFSITPSMLNLVLVTLLSILCGLIITFILFRKVIDIQPAEVLKQ